MASETTERERAVLPGGSRWRRLQAGESARCCHCETAFAEGWVRVGQPAEALCQRDFIRAIPTTTP